MIFQNIKIVCSIVMLSVVMNGCVSTGGTQSSSMLPVFTPQTVSKQPMIAVQIQREARVVRFPFSTTQGREDELNEWAQTLNADALVIVSHQPTRDGKKHTRIFADAVKFIKPTVENISKTLGNPLRSVDGATGGNNRSQKTPASYEVNSIIYHANKMPDPRYMDVMLTILKSNKISGRIKTKYAYYVVTHGKERFIKDYLYFITNPDVCSSCVTVFGKTLHQYGNAQYNKQYLAIMKKSADKIQIYGAQALAKFGTKKYSAEWVKILKFHSNKDIRIIAAEQLVKFGRTAEVEKAIANESDPKVKAKLKTLLLG